MSLQPQTVGLLLVPGFALMSYASVVEPLRAANLLAGKELYRWLHISPGPPVVEASCGATVPCPVKTGDSVKLDLLLVCAGGNPTAFRDRTTLQWLKTLAGRGLRIGGVSGGPVILARAGIAWESGLGADEARRDMAGFLTRIQKKRPQVILKMAFSADGKIAAGAGQRTAMATRLGSLTPRWIATTFTTRVGCG